MKKNILCGMAIAMAISTATVSYARYSVISNFSVRGEVNKTDASANAYVSLREVTDATLTIYLEESTNNGASYHVYDILDSQSGYGIGLRAEGSASGLDEDYKYRIKAEVVVDGGETEYKYLY
jgi:hypothetical protein